VETVTITVPAPELMQMDLPVTFDSPTVAYGLLGFAGAEDSTIVADPTNAANKVGKVVRSATAEVFAGTTLTIDGTLGFANKVPFGGGATRMKVRVYSPTAGIKVRLKVEDHTNNTISVETEATTTQVNTWETLTFDFATQVAGTPALDLTKNYDKATIFFNFGVGGAVAGAKTYYFDDLEMVGGTQMTQMDLPVTFDAANVMYGLLGFAGAEDSTIVADPTNAANKVGKVVRSATAEVFAGTTLTADGTLGFATRIPFTATAKKMKARVYSPTAGIKVRLKVEDHTNPTISVETEATTTAVNTWETLTFDFATQAAGTAALDLTKNYDKATIFFNFGVTGAVAGVKTYYFDDVEMAASALAQMDLPVTFDAANVAYGLLGFAGAEDSTIVADPTNAANKVGKVVRSATAEVFAGTTLTADGTLGFATRIPFAATAKRMKARVYSPTAGIKVRLKVEDHTNPTISVETEATTTAVNTWETLTFDFATQAAGTAALDLTKTYDKATIFFNFGVTGAVAGVKTYYFDDVEMAASALAQMDLPVTFDAANVAYGLLGFAGAEDSTIVADPTNAANKVGKVVRSATAELFAGTTLTADGTLGFATRIPFTATAKRMKARVYSPTAGIKVRLKVEDHTNNTISVETEATTTAVNTWETLTFDFATQAAGTAALDLTKNYDKATIFFNFGVTGAVAGVKTYYFDDVEMAAGGGGGGFAAITFDDAATTYTLTGFGGAENSMVVVDPTNAANKVARVIKSNTAELWAGATVSTGAMQSVGVIPFAANATTMTARVWSPHAGIPVRLKVEDAGDPTHSCETEAMVTVANGWQTLTFNFANQAAGTAALNLAFTYNKVSVFFNFGTTGAVAGERTYYLDDLAFGGGGGGGGGFAAITFDDAATTYTLTGFGGAENSMVVVDPTNAANKVARVVKSNTAELWAGATVSTGAMQSVGVIPFAANATTMTARVWSPHAGIPVRLKVEDAGDPTHSCETEAMVTVANGWQTLTFNFANQAAGTAALNLAFTYNKVSVFFNFGTTGAVAGERTYYLDDLAFGGGGGGGGGFAAITFDDAATTYTLTGFGGAESSMVVVDPTNAANKVARVIKSNTAELWAGATVSTGAMQSVGVLPFAANATTMTARVWSPHAGIPVRLKVEDAGDPTHSCETEAMVTVANGWQTLTFNFANQAAGTAALNLAFTYNKVSVFFNFGTTGAVAGERTYYLDDLAFGGGGGGFAAITFDDAATTYTMTGFGGAESSMVVVDPTNAANKVARVIKSNTAELWAGATVSTGANLTIATIPFSATAKRLTARVWSPHAGIPVRLKVEDAGDPTHSCETEAMVTVANGWQTLTFDFANQAAGTAALNLAFTFNRASVFFNFGTTGAVAGERTYYLDDLGMP
jgi:hypothetical protein